MGARATIIWFLCIEGTLGLIWCTLIVAEPGIGAWFLPAAVEPTSIATLFGADLVFFALLPLATAFGLGRRRAWARLLLLVHTGGVLYAALWAWGLLVTTGAGLRGAVLMTIPAVVLSRLLVTPIPEDEGAGVAR